MGSTLVGNVVSPSSQFLPTNGDTNIEIKESQFKLKQEEDEGNEYDIQQAYDELHASCV